jgi:hypothetical protein
MPRVVFAGTPLRLLQIVAATVSRYSSARGMPYLPRLDKSDGRECCRAECQVTHHALEGEVGYLDVNELELTDARKKFPLSHATSACMMSKEYV